MDIITSIIQGDDDPLGANINSSVSLYDRLHSSVGRKNAYHWFKKRCEGGNSMDENALILFLRQLTKRNDYEILDIIDIFDDKYEGTLSWDSFFLVLALYAALYSRQTVKFLYNHGEKMYGILNGHSSPETIDFQRFSSFAFILGIPEEDLVQSIVNDFKVNGDRLREQPISYDDFNVYYFSTLKKLDEGTVLQFTAQDLLKSSPLCACIIS
eukprot:TRINITY_DN28007_c0_g1_i1.p1 TRINITY_DN28007_c0_g1~~TRINITY_DN28007_c0_g1_i1.p1  ORF type:complete len:212 (+),score=52.77 TRINITY_DN28007_c0_g1_i1:121-756(+)